MKKLKRCLFLLFWLPLLAQTGKITEGIRPNWLRGQVLIRLTEPAHQRIGFSSNGEAFHADPTMAELIDLLAVSQIAPIFPEEQHTSVGKTRGLYRLYLLKFNHSLDMRDALLVLAGSADIEIAIPHYLYYPTDEPKGEPGSGSAPNDYDPMSQWGLDAVGIIPAWSRTQGCEAVKIAVLDMGFDMDHEDLVSNLHPTLRHDSVHHVLDPQFEAPVAGEDYLYPDQDPSHNATISHGTSVAGAAGATTNNGIGLAGVGWDTAIVPVRAGMRIWEVIRCLNGCHPNCDVLDCGDPECQCEPGEILDLVYREIFTEVNWLRALNWVRRNRAAEVVNMSFAGSFPSPIAESVVNAAADEGVVLVAASGNAGLGDVFFPAGFDAVIGVGATDQNDRRAFFSNFGTGLSLAAPGRDILVPEAGNTYSTKNGTSFAAPIVSGAAGLMLAVDPTLGSDQIRSILETTADQTGGYAYDPVTGKSLELGHGRLNAGAALQQVIAAVLPADIFLTGQTIGSGQDFQYLATQTVRLPKGVGLTVLGGGRLTINAGTRILLDGPVLIEEGAIFSAFIDEELTCIDP